MSIACKFFFVHSFLLYYCILLPTIYVDIIPGSYHSTSKICSPQFLCKSPSPHVFLYHQTTLVHKPKQPLFASIQRKDINFTEIFCTISISIEGRKSVNTVIKNQHFIEYFRLLLTSSECEIHLSAKCTIYTILYNTKYWHTKITLWY